MYLYNILPLNWLIGLISNLIAMFHNTDAWSSCEKNCFGPWCFAKAAKASKDAKIAEVGADIELLTKQSWISQVPGN